MKNIYYFLISIVSVILSIFLLSLFIRGGEDLKHFDDTLSTAIGSPFEASNSTSRYSLTWAIVENRSFVFNDRQARFSTPDLVKYEGKYFTIFTPGVSFLAIPFYILGKNIGYIQITTYLLNVFLAVINIFLISAIARKLQASYFAALLSGFLFVFATNALSYSQTLTQHHSSTALILISVLLALSKRTFLTNLFLGIVLGLGILIDIPNALFILPSIIYAFINQFEVKELGGKIKLFVKLNGIGILIGLIPLVMLFAVYNYVITGSYTKIGQMIGRIDYKPDEIEVVEKTRESGTNSFPYNTRAQIEGLRILLISDERGWFYYSPVIAIGIFGLILAFKNEKTQKPAILLTSVAAMVVLSYSMFGDPWGGWSFGPRYLIPASAAVMSAASVSITKFKRSVIFVVSLIVLTLYSVAVSTLGAITTNNIPPKIEAVALSQPIPWTYEYNLSFIEKGQVYSLVYNMFLEDAIAPQYYWYGATVIIFTIAALLYIGVLVETRKEK